jgi:hypothetical protein
MPRGGSIDGFAYTDTHRGGEEKFAPHVNAGFPPGGLSLDNIVNDDGRAAAWPSAIVPYLHWDASHQYPSLSTLPMVSEESNVVLSRLTVLIYLNDDFEGGHTKFYEPEIERRQRRRRVDDSEDRDNYAKEGVVIASVRPRAGSILIFPQAITEAAVERARGIWPLHEGRPVTSGTWRKYVIRTGVPFEKVVRNDIAASGEEDGTLGLDSYLQFLKGDAFNALDTHFSSRAETVDRL